MRKSKKEKYEQYLEARNKSILEMVSKLEELLGKEAAKHLIRKLSSLEVDSFNQERYQCDIVIKSLFGCIRKERK